MSPSHRSSPIERKDRRELKVLLVTGYDKQAAFGRRQMEVGMAIMSKPLNIDLLSTKLKDVLQAPSGELKPYQLDWQDLLGLQRAVVREQ